MANTKVTGDLIAQGTITTTNLADSSITAVKLNNITTDDLSEGSNLFYTDARVASYLTTNNYVTSSAIANTANWDEAYSWGDHALVGYLTSFTETDPIFTASDAFAITSTQITNWDTAYGWGNHAGLYSLLGHTHTESEITDFGNYITGITHDTVNTKLVVTNRDATTVDLSLAQYVDDTNLARLVSGTVNISTGIATFTRDDATTFDVDFSALLDDTNDYVASASFNTSDGVLTLTRFGGTTVTVDLDGRYLTSAFIEDKGSYTSDLDALTASGDQGWYSWSSTQPTNSPGWNYGGVLVIRDNSQNLQLALGGSGDNNQRIALRRANSGSYGPWTEFYSTADFSTTDISNWNTAYGWGDHSSAGYAAASSLSNYLPLAGGTMSGNINAGGNKITNLYGIVLNNEEKTDLTQDGQIALDLNDSSAPATLGTYGGTYPEGLYLYGSGNVYTIYHTGHFSGTNIANWETAYNYSQVGHLPLTGGTLTGNLNITQRLTMSENGTYNVAISNGQGAQIWLETEDSGAGQDLAKRFVITGNTATPYYYWYNGNKGSETVEMEFSPNANLLVYNKLSVGKSTDPTYILDVDGSASVSANLLVGTTSNTGIDGTANMVGNYLAVDGQAFILDPNYSTIKGRIAYNVGPQSYQPSIKTASDGGMSDASASDTGDFPNTAADSGGFASATTYTYAAAIAGLQGNGARLPRLEEVIAAYGEGTGDSTDSQWIWTQTKGYKDFVYQVRGDYEAYPEFRLVDPNDTNNVARVRRFFDVSKANLPVYYDSNSRINTKEIRAEHSDGLKLYDDGGNGIFVEDGGQVGINTASPSAKLHVDGSTKLVGTTTFNVGRGDVYFENNGNSNANGTGLTLRTSSNPTTGSIFDVRSSGQASRLWVGQSLTSAGSNPFYVGDVSTGGEASASNYSIELNDNGKITAEGDIVAYGSVSDIRQKENIEPIKSSLDRLNKINGITFNYKTKNPERRTLGVIAQELLKDEVLKLAVFEHEDFKAKDDDPLKHTYGVKYELLTAVLIEAVKELSSEVQELKNKLNGTN